MKVNEFTDSMIPKVPSVKSRITTVKGRLAKHLLGRREGASLLYQERPGTAHSRRDQAAMRPG